MNYFFKFTKKKLKKTKFLKFFNEKNLFFLDFKDIEEDTPMNKDQPKRLPQTGLIPDHLAKEIDLSPQPAEYRPDYKAL